MWGWMSRCYTSLLWGILRSDGFKNISVRSRMLDRRFEVDGAAKKTGGGGRGGAC